MKNITHVKELKKIVFPVPPLKEQLKIINHIDSLLNMINIIKKSQTEIDKETEEIIPSILDKAFNGELNKCKI